MCGIAGRSSRAPLDTGAASALGGAFEHALQRRGPCGSGWHHAEDLLLVHRRLSIVDLSEAGSQPMWNEDRTVCVVVNGEIYNFEALRRVLSAQGHRFRSLSDSEVIVHLYEDRGIRGCCDSIEGMFAFALWDARTRDLYLVRDRLGIKPLIVSEHANGLTFASTMPGLLADAAVPRDTRDEALVALMKWGFIPTPWSALRHARHLLPGSYLRVRGGVVKEEVAWWRDAPIVRRSSPEEVQTAIEAAIRSHLVADVPVGVLLSGGIDSGLVATLAARFSEPSELEAWTASQRGFAEDESGDAARTAKHAGVLLHEVPVGVTGVTADALAAVVEAMDEPLPISSLVGLHALFRAIAPDRRVVLSGDGGDELFAGYDWHAGMPQLPAWTQSALFRLAAPLLSRAPRYGGRMEALAITAALSRRHPGRLYADKLRVAHDDDLAAMGLPSLGDDPMELRAEETWERFEGMGTLEQMLAVDRATALVDEMLAKVDTASMAYSVEARVPFLADGVVEAAKGLRASHKRNGATGKTLLREWFRQVGPAGAADRAKTGFNSPLAAWFSGSARDYLLDNARAGASVLGIPALPAAPRLLFATAVLGAWHAEYARSPATGVGVFS
jgi:asparagine synthase (glutamine-hydrolysing)